MSDCTAAAGLAALGVEVARDLARLNHPPANWVPERAAPDGTPMTDVLIAGAGMNGLAAAFALRRLGIAGIRHVDRAEPGRAGPWLRYARMEYLRSPKHLTGPALGIPSLTFRAWWEAQHGPQGWAGLGHILRPDWAAYLDWYAQATGAGVAHGRDLVALLPRADGVEARLDDGTTVHARTVVLATGREGMARPRVPAVFAPWFGGRVVHSSDPIDFAALKGRRVAVIGLAASAYDNACAAAEAGAEVVLLGRAGTVPTVNKMKQTVYPGFAHGFPELPDAERLAWLRTVAQARIAPPRLTVRRAALAGVTVVTGAPVTQVSEAGEALRIETPAGTFDADLTILGTGFAFDLTAAGPLSALADRIETWGDRLGADEAPAGDEQRACPALGPDFGLRSKPGADVPGLGRIRCFGHAAQPSLGNLANDIPQASEGAERLARHIARTLFTEDAATHRARLEAFTDPELLGDAFEAGA